MRSVETMPKTHERAPALAVRAFCEEDIRYQIRGDVFFTMRDGQTGEVQLEREVRNLVVLDASILIARLMKNNAEVNLHGVLALAVGTGESGWDLQNPPAPTITQRSLYAELARKTFANTKFIDAAGVPTDRPTKVVDFTTTFAEAEAVGALVEMALLGGNISTNMNVRKPVQPPNGTYDSTIDLTLFDTQINHLCFKVINKPATSTLSITWRLTF